MNAMNIADLHTAAPSLSEHPAPSTHLMSAMGGVAGRRFTTTQHPFAKRKKTADLNRPAPSLSEHPKPSAHLMSAMDAVAERRLRTRKPPLTTVAVMISTHCTMALGMMHSAAMGMKMVMA